MEDKKSEERKYFTSVVSDNIRNFTSDLNKLGLTKDDVLSCFYNPSTGNYYAIIYV